MALLPSAYTQRSAPSRPDKKLTTMNKYLRLQTGLIFLLGTLAIPAQASCPANWVPACSTVKTSTDCGNSYSVPYTTCSGTWSNGCQGYTGPSGTCSAPIENTMVLNPDALIPAVPVHSGPTKGSHPFVTNHPNAPAARQAIASQLTADQKAALEAQAKQEAQQHHAQVAPERQKKMEAIGVKAGVTAGGAMAQEGIAACRAFKPTSASPGIPCVWSNNSCQNKPAPTSAGLPPGAPATCY